ncbi:hypothetical protein C8F04DRAFT_1265865 [Mycena alexandri]|uniref:BTB domain-containing protein n=1 Tax=Mycena alexandri TaxID=1745969 RepID=A0AAD6WV81_9AGAR|nr:hypothetical protein C8F04DRAFT_1265865 [Mycena alexandri]
MDVPDSTTVSPKFNFTDADVTFKSADGVLFHVHRKNLEVCTEGFPPAEISVTAGEISDLLETAETLELLFQFMYPERHPALDTTPFEILHPLAEAAEKYQVFPAMNICHIRLRDMVHEHPVEVAVYAAKHDYPYLVSQVAPMMLSMPPVDVIGMLPGYLVLPWIRYVQEWTQVHQTVALKFRHQNGTAYHFNGQPCNANSWLGYSFTCIERLAPGVHTLQSLDDVFHNDIPVYNSQYGRQSYECCRADLQAWRKRIEDAIAEIPKFHTFL